MVATCFVGYLTKFREQICEQFLENAACLVLLPTRAAFSSSFDVAHARQASRGERSLPSRDEAVHLAIVGVEPRVRAARAVDEAAALVSAHATIGRWCWG